MEKWREFNWIYDTSISDFIRKVKSKIYARTRAMTWAGSEGPVHDINGVTSLQLGTQNENGESGRRRTRGRKKSELRTNGEESERGNNSFKKKPHYSFRVLTCTINLSKTLMRIMPCVFICASRLLCYVSKRKLIFLGWGVLVALYSNKETKVRDSYTRGIIITQRGMFSRTVLLVWCVDTCWARPCHFPISLGPFVCMRVLLSASWASASVRTRASYQIMSPNGISGPCMLRMTGLVRTNKRRRRNHFADRRRWCGHTPTHRSRDRTKS
jgi:hypothetical protein